MYEEPNVQRPRSRTASRSASRPRSRPRSGSVVGRRLRARASLPAADLVVDGRSVGMPETRGMPQMVKAYSLRTDGDRKLSEHFRVREFACRDGSDEILVSEELVLLLEQIRVYFAEAVSITSAYRTPEYNRSVGGAPKSQHVLGKAADIRIKGAAFRAVAQYAEVLEAGGIGLYEYEGGFTHVDVRTGKSRWIQKNKNGSAETITTFGKIEGGETGEHDDDTDKETAASKPSSWAEEGASWAVEERLILGDETGNLRWQDTLTREQFAVILRRYHDRFGD